MLERWNIGFLKDISDFNFIVNPVGGGSINPILHCPLRGVGSTSRRPEPIIPLFHHSNCERSELTWAYILGLLSLDSGDCGGGAGFNHLFFQRAD